MALRRLCMALFATFSRTSTGSGVVVADVRCSVIGANAGEEFSNDTPEDFREARVEIEPCGRRSTSIGNGGGGGAKSSASTPGSI